MPGKEGNQNAKKPVTRNHSVHVRLQDQELELLNQVKGDNDRAGWLREQLLQVKPFVSGERVLLMGRFAEEFVCGAGIVEEVFLDEITLLPHVVVGSEVFDVYTQKFKLHGEEFWSVDQTLDPPCFLKPYDPAFEGHTLSVHRALKEQKVIPEITADITILSQELTEVLGKVQSKYGTPDTPYLSARLLQIRGSLERVLRELKNHPLP